MDLDRKKFEKDIKMIIKTGKYTIGLKETTKSLKGVKLLIYSNSLKDYQIELLKKQCKKLSVPVLAYPDSSSSLGIMCNKPFKVSVLSIRSAGDNIISSLGGN